MTESIHSLSTCRIPLSALTQYYRRNLSCGAASSARRRSIVVERRRHLPVEVDGAVRVVLTVVEFAAHVAYLEPMTGTGVLVAPRPGTDVVAPDDWFTGGLSLQTADRAHALQELERSGWRLLGNEQGMIEKAGRTTDGRLVVCLDASVDRQLVLEDLQRAITALHIAADLCHE
jgi:hypothetical protein